MIWLLTPFIIYATMWISILFHELGHLVCAMACGRKAMSFRVGSGKSIKFNFGTVKVELGRSPFGGGILYTRSVDWRKTIITASGGPVANALIAITSAVALFMGAPGWVWIVLVINAFYVWEDSVPVGNSDGMHIKRTLARKAAREKDYQDYLARNP